MAELGLMTNASLVACQVEKVSEKFQFLDFPTIPPLQRNPFLPFFPGRPRLAAGMRAKPLGLTSRAKRMAGDVLAKHAIHWRLPALPRRVEIGNDLGAVADGYE